MWASEQIYIENLSVGYAGITDPNVVGIWVALSPYNLGYGIGASSLSTVIANFLQAGYNLIISKSGKSLQYFVQGFDNSNQFVDIEKSVPGGYIENVYVYLQSLDNGTALAQFYVFYTNGNSWSNSVYVNWPWSINNKAAYTVMSIVESVQNIETGDKYELPYISGGMIHFTFAYSVNNNYYTGPGQIAPGTTL